MRSPTKYAAVAAIVTSPTTGIQSVAALAASRPATGPAVTAIAPRLAAAAHRSVFAPPSAFGEGSAMVKMSPAAPSTARPLLAVRPSGLSSSWPTRANGVVTAPSTVRAASAVASASSVPVGVCPKDGFCQYESPGNRAGSGLKIVRVLPSSEYAANVLVAGSHTRSVLPASLTSDPDGRVAQRRAARPDRLQVGDEMTVEELLHRLRGADRLIGREDALSHGAPSARRLPRCPCPPETFAIG